MLLSTIITPGKRNKTQTREGCWKLKEREEDYKMRRGKEGDRKVDRGFSEALVSIVILARAALV